MVIIRLSPAYFSYSNCAVMMMGSMVIMVMVVVMVGVMVAHVLVKMVKMVVIVMIIVAMSHSDCVFTYTVIHARSILEVCLFYMI